MKKAFLLLLLLPLLQIGCDKGPGCPPSERYFNISGIRLQPRATELKDKNYQVRMLTDQDSARFEDFSLNLYLDASYYSLNQKPAFSFFPKAYARDVDCPFAGYGGSEEKLAGLYLISLGKFDANTQPGDTLTQYAINSRPPSEYFSENSTNIKWQEFNIALAAKPDPKEFQSFKLVYMLTNGERYEATTPRFRLY